MSSSNKNNDTISSNKSSSMRGHVKWFSDSKGFGFILGDNAEEYFVHFSHINSDGFKTLLEGQHVSFSVTTTEKGQAATSVTVLDTLA